MQTDIKNFAEVTCSSFSTSAGCTEYFLTITSRDDATFDEALAEITDAYHAAMVDWQLDENTLQFTRIYVSDVSNEYQVLLDSELYNCLSAGAVSIIQQSPLCGPVTLLVYHIKDVNSVLVKDCVVNDSDSTLQSVYTTGQHYSLLLTANNTCGGSGSEKQTEGLFSIHCNTLNKYKMSLQNNTVRTWIYVRDIDNNYKGMVDARRELFSRVGLTDKTRYIASTGIEGKTAQTQLLVTMDSLSIGNLKEEQIVRMEALENLSSTIVYGVTFERGTRIRFGDRSHLYISGTASIDSKGDILHPEDIRGQTERTLDNIEALLKPHGATLENMRYLIIYVRNRKHYQFLQDILAARLPASVPLVPVEGAVCRPGWLIEMEGVAIIKDSTGYPPFF
jgi:enamine deaminase RidA (YjgF/YER057c/UK114 family)